MAAKSFPSRALRALEALEESHVDSVIVAVAEPDHIFSHDVQEIIRYRPHWIIRSAI